jgi:hypothetical protein
VRRNVPEVDRWGITITYGIERLLSGAVLSTQLLLVRRMLPLDASIAAHPPEGDADHLTAGAQGTKAVKALTKAREQPFSLALAHIRHRGERGHGVVHLISFGGWGGIGEHDVGGLDRTRWAGWAFQVPPESQKTV